MSQIDVPITITNVPGCSTPAPGSDTNESTLPTATVTVAGRPSASASSGRSVPARDPSTANSRPSFSAGDANPGYAASKYSTPGSPPSGDHIAL
jgi:hypothetical protein